ncbi:capsule assembly Wzi family protein [Mongoliibacter ruber]|uniref:Capsule assembly protein Wzi n=1 Tax=Mongoliibacter ruber TaxID=1750599 RepID=A0A2T0WNX7_9BACT|nr:capsule assembly Wzi family protein [Mongoliibacter ruber]PRY88407.1 capsule assembly protein Wzi [Mongoliibacter ruber]
MSFYSKLSICFGFAMLLNFQLLAQVTNLNLPIFDEYFRREQIKGNIMPDFSFTNRPFHLNKIVSNHTVNDSLYKEFTVADGISFSPLVSKLVFNSKRPYGWGMGLIQPGVGFQFYQNLGINYESKWLSVRLSPEILVNQNRPFEGFPNDFSDRITRERFFFWNNGDFPERFNEGFAFRPWLGQSSIALKIWKLSLGVATENIWWGPGQFNSLSFSNNAQGFPHVKLSTSEPIPFFLGNIEFNILSGRIEDSGLAPSQFSNLNTRFFREFSGDWKYLNSILFSYNPKWIKGLHLGFIRTNQQYSEFMTNSFGDIFPIFNAFQKVNFGFDRDEEGRDQQLILFGRLVIPSAKAELYTEYGRRDHSFNWREAIINPEHARAFLFGFNKLIDLPQSKYDLQVRGEVVHQQESVNRYIRYPGLRGNQTWHTHSRARGFTNYGQALGVGIGVGSNSQTMEFALVDGLNKKGILLERLENHQDFYYRAFGQQKRVKPWVDLSLGLLWDQRWNNFIFSSKVQMINAHNYQWQLADGRQEAFTKGQNLFSVFSNVQMVYIFK